MATETRLGLRSIVAAFGLSTTLLLVSSTLAGAQGARAVDADRMRSVHELERRHRAAVDARPPGTPVPAALREVGWMLEELRVSHFAQALGVRDGVSAKKIRRALDEAIAPGA